MGKLSALGVERYVSVEGYKDYADGDGLYLRVEPSGKRWYFRYTAVVEKKRTVISLGSYNKKTNSLSHARDAAAECKRLVRLGVDPKQRRQDAIAAQAYRLAETKSAEKRRDLTFEKVALEWFERKRTEWSNPKHQSQNINTLRTYVFPHIGHLPIGEIDQQHVRLCLDPIWWEKTETATRVRQRLQAVFGYAIANGYTSNNNPAVWTGLLSAIYPSAEALKRQSNLKKGADGHHAALDYAEAPRFYALLKEQAGVAAVALQFLILTVSRTQSVRYARWEQFDLEKKVWNVPAENMKGKIPFRVALSQQAVELIASMEKLSDYVFTSGAGLKPLSDGGMSSVLKRMNRKEITVHGFRSTFRDYIGEETGFPHRVAEFALAHQIKDSAEKAYARGDLLQKRFEMMNHWSAFLLGVDGLEER